MNTVDRSFYAEKRIEDWSSLEVDRLSKTAAVVFISQHKTKEAMKRERDRMRRNGYVQHWSGSCDFWVARPF